MLQIPDRASITLNGKSSLRHVSLKEAVFVFPPIPCLSYSYLWTCFIPCIEFLGWKKYTFKNSGEWILEVCGGCDLTEPVFFSSNVKMFASDAFELTLRQITLKNKQTNKNPKTFVGRTFQRELCL